MNRTFPFFIKNALFRYILPFFAFMLLTETQRFGSSSTIFWIYAFKTTVVGLLVVFLFKGYWRQEIKGQWSISAVLLGLGVLILWILPYELRGSNGSVTFNPEVFSDPAQRYLAIFFRLLGASLLVPIVEELFWRSFLMRYLIKPQFLEVPLGTYSHLSFWGTVLAFTLVHKSWEWPVAFLTAILYGAYLIKSKNLKGCILAHAVTNLGLGLFVLIKKAWYFW